MASSVEPADKSPRLGWLEAFVASAQHRNYEKAAHEIGLGSSAQRPVESLELWLHRVLLLGDVPLELATDPVLPPFLPVANEILEIFEACSAEDARRVRAGTVRRSKRSLVRLVDIETVRVVSRLTSFDSAAAELNCTYKTVRDRVRTVETALGGKVFEGRSRLTSSALGERFAPAARRVVSLLENARADISMFDLGTHRYDQLRGLISLRRAKAYGFIALTAGSESKAELVRQEQARKTISVLDGILDELRLNPNAAKDLLESTDLTSLLGLKTATARR